MVMTQAPTVVKIFASSTRQAELGITPRAFVLEVSERETAGWMVMRSCVYM